MNDPKAIATSANAAWNQAFNSADCKALAARYAENATLSPGNGQALLGHAEIEALFQSFIDNGVHNHQLEIITTGGSGNLIYQVAKWSANGAGIDGPAFGGITSSVLEQSTDGTWLTRAHVWNAAG